MIRGNYLGLKIKDFTFNGIQIKVARNVMVIMRYQSVLHTGEQLEAKIRTVILPLGYNEKGTLQNF